MTNKLGIAFELESYEFKKDYSWIWTIIIPLAILAFIINPWIHN